MWCRSQRVARVSRVVTPTATQAAVPSSCARGQRSLLSSAFGGEGGGAEEKGHAALVRREFAKQAQRNYDNQAASSDAMLSWISGHLAGDLQPSLRVLDVAAGTGRMSRLVAPKVKEVIAVDLTEEMMAVGKEQAQTAGLNNIHWVVSKAQQMPFMDNAFDVVVSRLAVHHWDEPQSIVSEMARVCKPGGKVVLIDIVTPEDLTDAQGDRLNHLERLRDPSHVCFWRLSELFGFLKKARPALSVLPLVDRRDNQVFLDQWLELTNTPSASRKAITDALQAELDGGGQQKDTNSLVTGFRPDRSADGSLHFVHSYVLLSAQKQ